MAENDRDYDLPDGRRIHCWTDEDGLDWVCLMRDSVCLGCRADTDGFLMPMVENVVDGVMTVDWDDDRGFVFRITPEGERQVEHMRDDPEPKA